MGRITEMMKSKAKRTFDEHATLKVIRYTDKAKSFRERIKPSYQKSVQEGKERIKRMVVGTRKAVRKEIRGSRTSRRRTSRKR